jgi:DNA-binding NtrC family response regulator
VLVPEDLPADVRAQSARAPELPRRRLTLEELKRWYVALVLDEAGGNKVRAAELLGIDRRTLYRILERADDPDD